MLWTMLVLFLILLVAGVVALYVAYPHRDQEMPHVPWLGEAMKRGVGALPTIDNQGEHARR